MTTFQTITDLAVKNNIRYAVCHGCGFVRLYDKKGKEYKARVMMTPDLLNKMISEILAP